MARQLIETEISFGTPVPAAQAEELARRVLFVDPEIQSFQLVTGEGTVSGVKLYTAAPADSAGLAAKFRSLVESDLAPQPSQPAKVVWRSPHTAASARDVFAEMAAAGVVSVCGQGQVAVGEPLISLLEGLDRRIRTLLAETFGAVEYRYPTLLPAWVLDATGYAAAFPQFLMFVTRLHADLDEYRRFHDSYRAAGGLAPELLQHCGDVDYCLPPTMCFHTFGQYRGRRLDPGPLHTVTSRGKSFRHESGYARTLERLWDFTIREVVFLGERQQVLDAREQLMLLIYNLVDELGLDGRCEVANDPFFAGADPAEKAWSQRQLELKYELRLGWAPGQDLAVGSFNFHDDFFGRSFDISRGDAGPVSSACAGFGLERLGYAVVCQHGLDPRDWPAPVRELSATGG